MRCNKRISLNANATKETYCMKELDHTDPKTGILGHDGPCEAYCCGRVLRAYGTVSTVSNMPRPSTVDDSVKQ